MPYGPPPSQQQQQQQQQQQEQLLLQQYAPADATAGALPPRCRSAEVTVLVERFLANRRRRQERVDATRDGSLG